MWSTPSSTARRSTASAWSRSRGGPNTPGPASCIAPNPIRRTGRSPNMVVFEVVMGTRCATVADRTRRASIVGLAPPPSQARRSELADFLRLRRGLVSPQSAGLEANGRRRTPGLRREEVAQLAGVGLSWYTWLEQGRDIHPSPQVLDAIARVLALEAAGRAHLCPRRARSSAAWRPRHEVIGEQAGTKTIEHPELGTLRVQHLQSSPTSDPELTIYVPADAQTRA